MPKHLIHFEKQLEALRKRFLSLGALVEENVQKAFAAFNEKNVELAVQVIESDDRVDRMEVEVEEECLKILALYQPVAVDLRVIVAILKINNDLERIADLAVNISERVIDFSRYGRGEAPAEFQQMAEKARWMLKSCLDAFIRMDSALAWKVCQADDEVDAYHRTMYVKIGNAIRKNPANIDYLFPLLNTSRHIERLADLATNISEDVIHVVEGRIIRHKTKEELKKTRDGDDG